MRYFSDHVNQLLLAGRHNPPPDNLRIPTANSVQHFPIRYLLMCPTCSTMRVNASLAMSVTCPSNASHGEMQPFSTIVTTRARAHCARCGVETGLYTSSPGNNTYCLPCFQYQQRRAGQLMRCLHCESLMTGNPSAPGLWVPNTPRPTQVCVGCFSLGAARVSVVHVEANPSLACGCGNTIALMNLSPNSPGICNRCLYTSHSDAARRILAPTPANSTPDFPADISVGIEVECIVRAWNPAIRNFGVIKSDASLRATHGGVPIELAMHPVTGADVVPRLTEIYDTLRTMYAYTNSSCGMHTHVSVASLNARERTRVRAWWRIFEPVFMLLVPPWRRNSSFCSWVHDLGESTWAGNRYCALNISSVNRFNTYEFRIPEGSMSVQYATFWASFLTNFVKVASTAELTNDILTFLGHAPDREILRFFLNEFKLPPRIRRQIVLLLGHYTENRASNYVARPTSGRRPTQLPKLTNPTEGAPACVASEAGSPTTPSTPGVPATSPAPSSTTGPRVGTSRQELRWHQVTGTAS